MVNTLTVGLRYSIIPSGDDWLVTYGKGGRRYFLLRRVGKGGLDTLESARRWVDYNLPRIARTPSARRCPLNRRHYD
jgi:hypothetical protein